MVQKLSKHSVVSSFSKKNKRMVLFKKKEQLIQPICRRLKLWKYLSSFKYSIVDFFNRGCNQKLDETSSPRATLVEASRN